MTTLFVSHGAPSLAIEPGKTGEALAHLAQTLPTPTGILVVSAHWDTSKPMVSLARQPETIHDFAGFPVTMYALQYPATGHPTLAKSVATLLNAQGIAVDLHPSRGLDHGAWVPLMLMYPEANIPVTQLSIQSRSTPAQHYAIGQALRSLQAQGVMILCSGAVTHNLYDLFTSEREAKPLGYVGAFADWVAARIEQQDTQALLNYRTACPVAQRAHPTEDHIMPLFVALGAGIGHATRLKPEYTYGILAMDMYYWG